MYVIPGRKKAVFPEGYLSISCKGGTDGASKFDTLFGRADEQGGLGHVQA
jgi:hypothetical protein